MESKIFSDIRSGTWSVSVFAYIPYFLYARHSSALAVLSTLINPSSFFQIIKCFVKSPVEHFITFFRLLHIPFEMEYNLHISLMKRDRCCTYSMKR